MHEASLIADLMRRIGDLAREREAKRVVGVSVWLGALSHMSAQHFAEHFEHAAAGTIAEGAALDTTLSVDIGDPNAQHIVLKSVEVET